MKSNFLSVLVAGLILSVGACSSDGDRIEAAIGIPGAPAWVNQGTRASVDDGRRMIHGVGSAPAAEDRSTQKSAADERARFEVNRILASYLEFVVDEFGTGNRSVSGNDGLLQQINTDSRVMLRGARIVGNWRDSREGTLYAFAQLDLETVLDSVRNNALLDTGFRQFMLDNGEDIFDRVHQRVR